MTLSETEAFTPLPITPASSLDRQDFKVLRAQHPEQAVPYSAANPSISATGTAPPHTHPGCEPRVTLQRDGDQITGIHIQCSCGRIIDLTCVYSQEKK
jgi:hypothetical protein